MANQSESPEPDARQLQDDLLQDALASGRSYSEAGQLVGLSGRSVRRRMTDLNFRSVVLSRMAERNTQLSGLMSEESIGAVERLVQLTQHIDPHIRLRAIQILLSNAIRTRREVELNERITLLEARLSPESEEQES